MLNALKKLWTAFFVAVLLFPVALVVGTLVQMANPDCLTCGINIAVTLWIVGVAAHQPVVWVKNNLSFIRRFTIWFAACAVGSVTYLGVEALAASLLASGNVPMALRLGFAANQVGALVAPVASFVLVRRSSSRRRSASLRA